MGPSEPNEAAPGSGASTTHRGTAPAPSRKGSNRFRNALWVAGAVALAFLIGFGWQFNRAQRLSAELAVVRHELTLRDLEATLAAATVEAQRNNHESARRLASQFFTGLQQEVANAPPNTEPQLRGLLAQRDTTITSLSRGAPASAQLLNDQLERYRAAVHGQDEALPPPEQEPEPGPSDGSSEPPARD